MQAQSSNVNFGMAFRSPSKSAMPYFKKYLANGTGKIDTEALGDFVIRQSKNKKVDMQYLHTKNGDVFEVFAVDNPYYKNVTIPIKSTEMDKPQKKGFLEGIKDWYNTKCANYKYVSEGSWANLPPELKQAGETADKLEKELV